MKLYTIMPKLKAENIYVSINAKESRMFEYFVKPSGDGKFLQYISLEGRVDFGVKDKDLEKTDYLEAFVSLPIFSEDFVRSLKDEIYDEMTFYPIEISAHTIKKRFFIAKINRYLELIDYENSDTKKIGEEISLDYFGKIVFNENLPEFWIARDSRSYTDYYISEKMKNLIEKHKLKIDFCEIVF